MKTPTPLPSEADLRGEWSQPLRSAFVLFSASAAVFGLLALMLGPFVLTSRTDPSHISGGIVLILVGLVMIVESSYFLLSSAMRVRFYKDGHFVFMNRRRTLMIGPGQLRSVRCVWPDPQRWLPMRVRSANGNIMVVPRMPDAAYLFEALQRANPEAKITNPLTLSRRP